MKSPLAMGVSEPLIQASLLGEAAEHAPFAVLVADEEGRYVAVNQAACLMLGYSREELLRLGMRDVARYAEAAGEFDDLVDAGSKLGVSDLTRKDGSTVRFSYVAGATIVAGMSVYVAVGAAAGDD
jgi:PAS domain S-box-containing protein